MPGVRPLRRRRRRPRENSSCAARFQWWRVVDVLAHDSSGCNSVTDLPWSCGGPLGQGRVRLQGDSQRLAIVDARGQVVSQGTPDAGDARAPRVDPAAGGADPLGAWARQPRISPLARSNMMQMAGWWVSSSWAGPLPVLVIGSWRLELSGAGFPPRSPLSAQAIGVLMVVSDWRL